MIRPIRRAIDAHLGSRDVTRVIYGSVIGLALVVALQAHSSTAAETAGAIVGTALAVALADCYSRVIGAEARTRGPVRLQQVRSAAADAGAVLFGAAFPALFFVLAAGGAMDVGLAFTLAKWTGLGLICLYGFAAGRLSGSSVGGALMHAALVGVIGAGVIALKSLMH